MRPTDPFALPMWEAKQYHDPEGRHITHHVCVRGELPDAVPEFLGHCLILQRNDQGQIAGQLPFVFPIRADDLGSAFRLFDPAKDEAFEQWRRQQAQQAAQAGGLVVPNAQQARDILHRVK